MMATTTLLSGTMAGRLGWVLVHFVWQGTLVALTAGAVLRAMRDRSASARYLVAVAALAVLAAMPLATLLTSGARGPAMPVGAGDPTAARAGAEPVIVVAPMPRAGGQADEGAATAQACGKADAERTDRRTRQSESWLAAGAGLLRQGGAWLGGRLSVVVGVYLVGAALLLLWRGVGLVQVGRLVHGQLTEAPADVRARAAELARRMGVSRPVRVLVSARVAAPMLVGALRSVILLPAAMLTGLGPRQVEAILAHELAHVRRWDFLVNAFQVLIETLGFYHPAVWWLSRRVRQEREHCCDDLAVPACGDRLTYARALAALAALPSAAAPPPALAASGGSLLARIRRIAGVTSRRPCVRSWAILAPSALAVVVLAAAAWLAVAAGTEVSGPSGAGKQPARAAEMQVRVYDIRGIATKVRDFQPERLGWSIAEADPARPGKAAPGRGPRARAGAPPAREKEFPPGDPRRLAGLIRLVRESIAPSSWETAGGRGRIVPLQGQLVVRATPAVQEQVADLLAQLAKEEPVQIVVESRFIQVDAKGDGKLQAWLAKHAPAAPGRAGHQLDTRTAGNLVKLVQAEPAASVLSAPKVIVRTGQQAYIMVGSQEAHSLPLGAGGKGVLATHSSGIVLALRCVASVDRTRIRTLHDATVAASVMAGKMPESHRAHHRAWTDLAHGRALVVRMSTKRYRPTGLKETPAADGGKPTCEITEQLIGQAKPSKFVYVLISPRILAQADRGP